ncbi:MAG TPA: HAD hydrolase-like protein [Holophagaceae bacterium]|jgi:phosphoglycolate phosphatase|nr:HAD hydrolase-like protein [Holophagaceae bacterium]
MPSLILFDLDGTIVDPLLGITNCVRRVCREMDLVAPEQAVIRGWIGFGMLESLGQIKGLEDPARLEEALDRYWEAYREDGVFEHELYPGVTNLLHRLKRQGHRVYVVSAKPGVFARRIAYQFDLNLIFDDIFGAELKGRWQPKTDVLARLRAQGTIWPGGILIGDRGDDMRAAKTHGLHAVGVTYGYGSREELISGGAEALVDSVAELDVWLEKHAGGDEVHDAFSRAE